MKFSIEVARNDNVSGDSELRLVAEDGRYLQLSTPADTVHARLVDKRKRASSVVIANELLDKLVQMGRDKPETGTLADVFQSEALTGEEVECCGDPLEMLVADGAQLHDALERLPNYRGAVELEDDGFGRLVPRPNGAMDEPGVYLVRVKAR